MPSIRVHTYTLWIITWTRGVGATVVRIPAAMTRWIPNGGGWPRTHLGSCAFRCGKFSRVLITAPTEPDRQSGLTPTGNLPREILRRAAAYAAHALDGAIRESHASDRILVIEKSATAVLRAQVERGSAGRVLPLVCDVSRRITHVARVRDVANVSAFASIGCAATAMATLVQFSRIDTAIATVAAKVYAVIEDMRIDREASRYAMSDFLEQLECDAWAWPKP